MTPSFADLFDAGFLAAVSRLSLRVRRAPPRIGPGVHLSRQNGQSMSFRDYQAYTPGDDLRRVDWAVYGRTRHLFVRRFERPTATAVTVLVDASASMLLETPSRYASAARVAAAVSSAATADHNPLRVVVADGSARPPARPVTGRTGLVRALGDLAATHAADADHPGPGRPLR